MIYPLKKLFKQSKHIFVYAKEINDHEKSDDITFFIEFNINIKTVAYITKRLFTISYDKYDSSDR